MFNLEYTKDIKELMEVVIIPLLVVIIPALYAMYIKITRKIKELKTILHKSGENPLKAWENSFSRTVIQSIGFYLDGTECNPYCKAEQILYIALEDGVVGPSRIHSMYMSIQAESSGPSRLPKKADAFQRVPYATVNSFCGEIDSGEVLRIPDMEQSKFKDLAIFDTARSALAVPVYTKEHWFAGVIVFNYLDQNFNRQEDISKDIEFIQNVRSYIEGQMLQMDLARMAWLKEHKGEYSEGE